MPLLFNHIRRTTLAYSSKLQNVTHNLSPSAARPCHEMAIKPMMMDKMKQLLMLFLELSPFPAAIITCLSPCSFYCLDLNLFCGINFIHCYQLRWFRDDTIALINLDMTAEPQQNGSFIVASLSTNPF